jgi:hypothetical protein
MLELRLTKLLELVYINHLDNKLQVKGKKFPFQFLLSKLDSTFQPLQL